jgi:hypothetical protein
MSYDLKIQNYCDHKILWSRGQLEPDRKTVYLPYPIASVASLKVRVNGELSASNSYSIKTVRQTLSLVVVSSIVFFNKIKHYDPIIEFFYVTLPDTCPKCLGVKTVDDLLINGHGDYEVISKEVLLLQQVEKIIVTKLSSNLFHGWYGTELHSLIGTKIFDKKLLYTRVREQVSTAIDKLKNIQNQMQASGRKFDPGELFGKLLKIDIEDTEDPSMILVIVTFTSQSNTSIEYSQYLSMNETSRQRLVF